MDFLCEHIPDVSFRYLQNNPVNEDNIGFCLLFIGHFNSKIC